MIVNDASVRIRKEVTASFEILPLHFPGETEERMKRLNQDSWLL
jgi:hypothetical protein